jgi:hypothetical protein
MIKRLLILLFPITGFSQNIYFEKTFGTALQDISRSVKQLNSGSIFILGNSTSGNLGNGDISLTKLDKYGNWEWTEYYGTSNIENGFYLNKTSDGNFVFTAESETSSNDLDILIYKVDTSGNVLWNRTYASPVNESPKYIEQTNDGGVILAGYQNDTFGYNNSLVLKLDSNGIYQWHKSIGGNQNDYADMIHQLDNNKYVLTGDTKSFGAGGYDVVLYELDSIGNINWAYPYGDTLQNGCQGVLLTSANNYLSYGETEIYPSSPYDFFAEKIDRNGSSIWRHTYGGVGTDAAFSAIETSDGGFVFTGYSNSYNGGAPIDLIIFKIDSSGSFLWEKTYGGAGIDIGYEIIHSTISQGYVITGKTFNNTEEYYVLQLDENALITGIKDQPLRKENSFEISPNPADRFTELNYKTSEMSKEYKIVIYNIMGQSINEIILPEKKASIKIDLAEIHSGIYFIRLIADGKIITSQKLMISHQ